MIKKALINSLCCFIFLYSPVLSWDGYEPITGDYVNINTRDIKKNNFVEYYDHYSGIYKTGIIESIEVKKHVTKVQLQDLESNSYRSFDMENVRNNLNLLKYNY